MDLKFIAEIIFYLLMVIFALYSLEMIYALLRFSKSRMLGIILSAIYLIIIFSLYGAAAINLRMVRFMVTESVRDGAGR